MLTVFERKIIRIIRGLVEDKQPDTKLGEKIRAVLNLDVPIANWKLLRVGSVFKQAVLVSFVVDMDILEQKGNSLTFCLDTARAFTSKGGLVVDSEKDAEEEVIRSLTDLKIEVHPKWMVMRR